jgi:type IV secretory pathway TrbD component
MRALVHAVEGWIGALALMGLMVWIVVALAMSAEARRQARMEDEGEDA